MQQNKTDVHIVGAEIESDREIHKLAPAWTAAESPPRFRSRCRRPQEYLAPGLGRRCMARRDARIHTKSIVHYCSLVQPACRAIPFEVF